MDDTVIVFTGKIYPFCIKRLIEETRSIPHKIASVWDNEPQEYVSDLSNNNFSIVVNKISDTELYTPQFVTIVSGVNCAKERGFKYIMRTRFDIVSTDYTLYLEKTRHLYENKLTTICGLASGIIFFDDRMIVGEADKMCKLYKLQRRGDSRYPEQFLMETYSNKTNLRHADIRVIFNFSLNICREHNIEFIWYRPHWSHVPHDMKYIGLYCKGSHVWL